MNTLLDHDSAPPEEEEVHIANRSFAKWLASGWIAALSLWVVVSFVQLRAVAALIELEGARRGSPISANDHFAYLPELQAAFEAANLSWQHPYFWFLVMVAFAVSGLVVAAVVERSALQHKSRILSAMPVIFGLGVIVAVANRETLDLVLWLTN